MVHLAIAGSIAHRPPHDFRREVRRPARAGPARQDLPLVSWSTTSTSAAGAVPPTSPSPSRKLGHRPLLVGAVGHDFDVEYRGWLDAAGVDTSGVQVSETRHTARCFVCTTTPTWRRSRRSTPVRWPRPATSTSRRSAPTSTSCSSAPTTPRACSGTPGHAATTASRSPPTPRSSSRGPKVTSSATSSTVRPTCSATTTSRH
ncbi:PfkB family carbohydrate kinase [Aeromicrobium sp. UC242_57]|uniref:PfkB family carbohydrate kinase n=1 Tax=Aeromicrobium sp. UC242_57 TaxID=3374624 RepID=UPI00378EB958